MDSNRTIPGKATGIWSITLPYSFPPRLPIRTRLLPALWMIVFRFCQFVIGFGHWVIRPDRIQNYTSQLPSYVMNQDRGWWISPAWNYIGLVDHRRCSCRSAPSVEPQISLRTCATHDNETQQYNIAHATEPQGLFREPAPRIQIGTMNQDREEIPQSPHWFCRWPVLPWTRTGPGLAPHFDQFSNVFAARAGYRDLLVDHNIIYDKTNSECASRIINTLLAKTKTEMNPVQISQDLTAENCKCDNTTLLTAVKNHWESRLCCPKANVLASTVRVQFRSGSRAPILWGDWTFGNSVRAFEHTWNSQIHQETPIMNGVSRNANNESMRSLVI